MENLQAFLVKSSSLVYDIIISCLSTVSMYTNIDTDDCIASISEFLKRPSTYMRFQHYSSTTLIEALTIVMKNNRFRFGDLLVKQLMGIALHENEKGG